MSTSSSMNPYDAQIGKIAQIDMLEDEEDAMFSDGGESLSSDSDDDDSFDVKDALEGSGTSIASHLAFLAGAIQSHPASGVAAPGQGADDEEDEYIPDPSGAEDIAKLGSAEQTEHVVVDMSQLHLGLSSAAAEAAKRQEEIKARAAAVDEDEAEFSDSDDEPSDEDMDDKGDESTDKHLQFLASTGDASMDEDDDDEYIPN